MSSPVSTSVRRRVVVIAAAALAGLAVTTTGTAAAVQATEASGDRPTILLRGFAGGDSRSPSPSSMRTKPPEASPRSYLPGFVLDGGRYRAFDSPDPSIGLFPSGINNRGEITGEYLRPDGESGLYRDRRGRISSFDVPGAMGTEAVRISDRGQIVGEYSNDTPFVNDSAAVHAYVTDRGRFVRIDVPGAERTTAFGVNDRGRVVGGYVEEGAPRNPDGTYQEFHGYLWRNGRFRTIDVPGAPGTELYEINDRGDVLGIYSGTRVGEQHGFLLDRHGRITEIDVPGGQYTIPFGLNDRGQVVGYTADIGPDGGATNIHGFALLKGVNGPVTRVDFPGAPQTAALGINDRGQIVGAYENPNAGASAQRSRAPAMPLLDSISLGPADGTGTR
jgi:uncharacterized membrane protein